MKIDFTHFCFIWHLQIRIKLNVTDFNFFINFLERIKYPITFHISILGIRVIAKFDYENEVTAYTVFGYASYISLVHLWYLSTNVKAESNALSVDLLAGLKEAE